jgi:N-acylneuraminate cytidylyltransferase
MILNNKIVINLGEVRMKHKNIAIIPARGGSKRIQKKNIKDFLGKPIIYYSIKAALESNIFDTVMVSTDDDEIADISKQYGAEVPFLRSKETATDYATTEDVIKEVIFEYHKRGKIYDTACCIYPTAIFVTGEKIKNAITMLWERNADSIIPVVKYSYPPQRSFVIQKEKLIMKYSEYLTTNSQDLEEWYHDSGQFYCMKTDAFMENNGITNNNTLPIILPEMEVQDIDNESDWEIAKIKYLMFNDKTHSSI